jgi:predicted small lipoprotein YifL
MRPSRWLSLLFALLLLAGCGQKGKLYHPGEPMPTPSDAPTHPEPDATAPSEPQPPSDF